jgi:iron complex outermembrane receptor protein
MTIKKLLLASASAAAVSAIAVTAAGAADAPTQVAAASTASAPVQVGEVVITAEKREQNLQQVPIAVSAFTSKQRDIQGIENIQDLTNFTPGLTYSSQLDRAQMRGIGRLSNLLSADAAVAVYSDDFFTTSTTEAGRDTLFVDRVEVLRGPQGTLYGRNAIAGAINIVSKRPTPTPYAEARTYFGNYGFKQFEAALSDTFADKLGIRISGYDIEQTDGYDTNLYPGLPSEGGVAHNWYAEAQIQLRPNDHIDWWVKAFTQGWNNMATAPGALLFTPTIGAYDHALNSPYDGLTFNPGFAYANAHDPLQPIPGSVQGGCGVTDNPAITNIRNFCHNTSGVIDLNKTYAFVSHFTYHLPSVDVKYVAGYDHYDYYSTQDWDSLGVDSYQIPLKPGATCSPLFVSLGICKPFTAYPTETLVYPEFNRWYSHELTFSSTSAGRFQWILGGYYFNEHYRNPVLIATDPRQTEVIGQRGGMVWAASFLNGVLGKPPPEPDFGLYNANYDMHTRSEAVYGQFTWKLLDELKFTGGVRYTYDKKQGVEFYRLILTGAADATDLGTFTPAVDVTPFVAAGALPVAFGGVAPSVKGVSSPTTYVPSTGHWTRGLEDTSDAVTGTARIEWTPDMDTLVYGSYSRGYKAFAFNAGTIAFGNEAEPEFADAFEVGAKKTLGGRVQIDAALFLTNYHQAQIPIGVNIGGTIQNQFKNIPEARTEGFEYAAIWAPIDRLQLSLTYSYNKTEVLSGCALVNGVATGTCFVDAADPLALLPGADPVGGFLGQNGGTAAGCAVVQNPITCARLQGVKGNPLPQAPANKIAFNANYTWDFEAGSLTLSGTYIWKDRSFAGVFERKRESAPPWNQVDARLLWSGRKDKYEVILYVKNLFDTKGYNSAGAGIPLSYGTTTAYDLTPPRLYGVELHYKVF